MKIFIKLTLSALFLFSAFSSYSQKLPQVQQAGVLAPEKVKVDGRLTEWGNQFEAYNKSTETFYIIANNSSNLYLVIKISDVDIIEKFAKGGISVVISNPDKKQNDSTVKITFPIYDKDHKNFGLLLNAGPEKTRDSLKNKMQADSFLNVLNHIINENMQMIGIKGIKEISDIEIPIYNTTGIKAAAQLDNVLNFICEMAIPLKYLSFDGGGKLKYTLILNGVAYGGSNIRTVETSHGEMVIFTGADGVNYGTGKTAADSFKEIAPTHLSGEYTLVKK